MPKRLLLRGHVQGVGCRNYCSVQGRRMGLHGFASNMPDGTVEVLLATDNSNSAEAYRNELMENKNGITFYGRITTIDMAEYHGPLEGDYSF